MRRMPSGSETTQDDCLFSGIICFNRNYRDSLSVAVFSLVFDDSVDPGEESIVAAHTNVFPWMNIRAGLSHKDVARPYQLPGKTFNSQALSRAVPSISRTSSCFFMGHDITSCPYRTFDFISDSALE
jgi:hypothetical protein